MFQRQPFAELGNRARHRNVDPARDVLVGSYRLDAYRAPGWPDGGGHVTHLYPPLPETKTPPSSIIIERVRPELDGGRYPVKRVVGDVLQVSADIF